MILNRIYSFVLFVVLICPYPLQAQDYSSFLNEEDPREKAEIGLELWNKYLRSYQDSVKITAVELLMVAAEKEDKFARAVGTRMLGSYLFRSGKLDQGLEYLVSSIDYFEKNEDYVTSSEIYNEIGHVLLLKGEYDEAIQTYKKSLKFGKKSIDPSAEYNGEIGLGKAYISMGDTSIGLNFIHNYKQLAIEQHKYEAASDALAYLGMIESDRGNSELSNQYYYRSLTFSRKSKSKIHISHGYNNLGIVKFFAGEMDTAQYYLEESMKIRLELNNQKAIIEGYHNLGFFFCEKGETDKGIMLLNKGRELAIKNEFIADEVELIQELIDVYSKLGNSDIISVLKTEQDKLKKTLNSQKGFDDKIIQSIDLNFEGKIDKVKKTNKGDIGWKELTIGILIVSLVVLFFSEKRRVN